MEASIKSICDESSKTQENKTNGQLMPKTMKSAKKIGFKKESLLLEQPEDKKRCSLLDELKEFKNTLPNSMKYVESSQHIDLDTFDQSETDFESLFSSFAVYGITDTAIKDDEEPGTIYEGDIVFTDQIPTQTIIHTASLVFPKGVTMQEYIKENALEEISKIVNNDLKEARPFVLMFEPVELTPPPQDGTPTSPLEIMNLESRLYAVCLPVDDFTVVEKPITLKTSLQLKESNQPKKKKKQALSCKVIEEMSEEITNNVDNMTIQKTTRIYTIFTKYPLFSFYEKVLKAIILKTNVEKIAHLKEAGDNVNEVDSRFTITRVKSFYEQFKLNNLSNHIGMNRVKCFQIDSNIGVNIELSVEKCERYCAQTWSYPIISLFTLDIFLEMFTLVMLQEKVVIVCEDKSILTQTAFLFTKVFTRPFSYPYPVVSIIPDNTEYLNAPFPIVYGFLTSKESIMKHKIPSYFPNVYVFLSPRGVQIHSEKDIRKVVAKKSPKLRDILLPHFIDMQKNFPEIKTKTMLLDLFNIGQKKYSTQNNEDIARKVIQGVQQYMHREIYQHLPTQQELFKISKSVAERVNQSEEHLDLNHETYDEFKRIYRKKSKDPFFLEFIETQLVNVFLFR